MNVNKTIPPFELEAIAALHDKYIRACDFKRADGVRRVLDILGVEYKLDREGLINA